MGRPSRSLEALSALADLVLPQRCAGCGAQPGLLCPLCRAALAGPARRTRPVPEPAGLPPTFAVAAYDGVVRTLLVAHKERARLGLARPLGDALARAVAAATAGGGATLVPVPSARAAVRARGHEPVRRSAVRAAARLRADGLAADCLPVLRQQRRTADQAGLTVAERAANLAGALGVPPGLRAVVTGRRVVVLDDVVTTGATLVEAARALSAAGATVVGAAVVAATQRRPPTSRDREPDYTSST